MTTEKTQSPEELQAVANYRKDLAAQDGTEIEAKAPATTSSVTRADASKFVFVDDLRKVLDLAYATGENLILFGKGGHGKSEVSEDFFHKKNIEPFVKTMGSGTTTETLFGGIDIKEFQQTGKLHYLVEESFMNHEFVILEELFDAPPFILEQLKDILTSKQFRNGSQLFNIKTKMIVCCTNKTREEFSKNDSLKALMERFPLEYKVEWTNYTRVSYDFMYDKLMGKKYPELSFLMEKLAQNGTIVSPRTAVKAARIVDTNKGNLDCLAFIADFSGKNAALIKTELGKFKNVRVIEELMAQIDEIIIEANKIKLDSLSDIGGLRKYATDMAGLVKTLKSKKADDEMMQRVAVATKTYDEFITNKTKQISHATSLK